ncbi:MAG: DUF2252 domain-containing protein [Actinomycetes bacterium]
MTVEHRVASPLGHATVSTGERVLVGRSKRVDVPRSSHGDWEPDPDRPDPVELLGEQEVGRLLDLVPLRHARMSLDPFSFYRGAAALMAWDLTHAPHTDLFVQMGGDAHIANFGLYAAPNRELVFDANDFDETLPGPWEFDLKRLLVSLVVGGRSLGITGKGSDRLVRAAVAAYRQVLGEYAAMSDADVWYSRIRMSDVRHLAERDSELLAVVKATMTRATRNTAQRAHAKLVDRDGPSPVFRNTRPILVRLADLPQEFTGALGAEIEQVVTKYQRSLPDHLKVLMGRYEVLDVARKVVGVGSVGTECYIVLLQGRRMADPFILQVKQAVASVYEGDLPKSRYRTSGARVVAGQHLIQAASDPFLGSFTTQSGTSYYVRQFRDAKGSFDVATMSAHLLSRYGELCARSLARAHARSGDSMAIQGYIGKGSAFDEAMVRYSVAYADQNERDYERFRSAFAG